MYYDSLKQKVRTATKRKDAERQGREAVANMNVLEHIAPCYYDLHQDVIEGRHQYFNLPGGRGSCKSSFVSLEIVAGMMNDPDANAIVFRRVGATLRESVYSQIAWALEQLGVSHLWRGGVSPMCYTYLPTGQQIHFKGLDDVSKLKSIKPRRGIFRYIWIEEFSELTGPNMVRSLQQSVIRGGDNFLVFRSFNPPISAGNWANVFVAQPDDRAVTLLTNYTQIPPEWLGRDFIAEAERLKEINPVAYQHEYMGEPTGTGGEVFPNVTVRTITDEEVDQQQYVYHGVDFGFAQDPACVVRVSYDRKHERIMFLGEIYQRHLSNAELAQAIKAKGWEYTGKTWTSIFMGPGTYPEEAVFVCDAAEPKSIGDLRGLGLKCVACHKEPGCVQYRVKWLQHREIVIDPARTPNAHREFVNYNYGTDKDGTFTSELPDRDNHAIDSLAYALNSQIYTNKRPA